MDQLSISSQAALVASSAVQTTAITAAQLWNILSVLFALLGVAMASTGVYMRIIGVPK